MSISGNEMLALHFEVSWACTSSTLKATTACHSLQPDTFAGLFTADLEVGDMPTMCSLKVTSNNVASQVSCISARAVLGQWTGVSAMVQPDRK